MHASTPQLFALAVAIWSTTWFAITFQVAAAPPETAVAWRFAVAAALLAGFCRATGRSLRFPPAVHLRLALLGISMFCLSYLAVYRAETLLVSGLVAVGYSASPLLNMAVSRLAMGTRGSWPVALGGLLGMGGISLVFWQEIAGAEAGTAALAGAAFTAGAVLASSVGNVFAARLAGRGLDVWQKMAWGMAYGAAGSGLAALASGAGLAIPLTVPFLASLLYLALLGSIAAFAAYLTLLERVGAARAGYVGVMTPVVALAISGAAEGFRWGPLTWAGVAVVVAGNVVMLRSR
jgi:drug/metabolite transporter (DMT)-like permease